MNEENELQNPVSEEDMDTTAADDLSDDVEETDEDADDMDDDADDGAAVTEDEE